MMRRLATIGGLLLLLAHLLIATDRSKWEQGGPASGADAPGYWAWTASVLVDHDLDTGNQLAAHPYAGWEGQRNRASKYPVGIALLTLPGAAVGSVVAGVFGWVRDGYSVAEQEGAALGLLALVATFPMVMAALGRRRYGLTPLTAAVSAALVLLGTNALFYVTLGLFNAHAAAAALVALVYTEVARDDETRPWLVGAAAGLTIAVRPVDAVLILPVLLVAGWRWVRRRELPAAAAALAVASLPIAAQLVAWRVSQGRWLMLGYPGEGFTNLTSPKLLSSLFDPHRNGLFPWAPLFALCLAGFLMPCGAPRRRLWPEERAGLVGLAVLWYLNASWSSPEFGASFGGRPYVDALAVFGMGGLRLASWAAEDRRRMVPTALLAATFAGFTATICVAYARGAVVF